MDLSATDCEVSEGEEQKRAGWEEGKSGEKTRHTVWAVSCKDRQKKIIISSKLWKGGGQQEVSGCKWSDHEGPKKHSCGRHALSDYIT